MIAVAHAVILSWGWRRAAIAFVAGAAGALAMPPFGFAPALAVSLCVAVWLVDGAGEGGRFGPARSAALAGWFWGFGYFLAGLWWLGAAFLVEAERFAWAMPLGVVGLPAGLAFFFAFGFGAARLIWSRGAWRVLALAAGLGLAEWLRGHLFTGFPWNPLGMALGQNIWTMQSVSTLGLYGLTIVTVAIAAAPATLATGSTTRGRVLPCMLAVAAIAGLVVYGAVRLPTQPTPLTPDVRLRIMQPNLTQDAKFNPDNREEIMALYLRLSDRATSPATSGVADATHLIWSESAFPFLLHRDARALAQIAGLLPDGVTLLTGAARVEETLSGEGFDFYNAIHAIGSNGAVLATYDKVHLVPFGEYLPGVFDGALRALGLREFVAVPGGFTAGARRAALVAPGLPPAAATICYEAIFPGAVRPAGPGAVEPGWILNVTNDAWFGDTPGPRQHFAQARLRAVEEGLPLVRAANTGISAVIDPYGRIVASLGVGMEGVVDAGLPEMAPPTLFSRFGDSVFWLLFLFCGVAATTMRRSDS
ncbi:MAG: apolipoprotein N-acyltransferase [Salinarimonadaceae bacterium]|nr:MAG: apolipoprotein N-acyltransferase [Salinarimonadaceae bacterium]